MSERNVCDGGRRGRGWCSGTTPERIPFGPREADYVPRCTGFHFRKPRCPDIAATKRRACQLLSERPKDLPNGKRPLVDILREVVREIYAKDLPTHTCIVDPFRGRCSTCGAEYPDVAEAYGIDRTQPLPPVSEALASEMREARARVLAEIDRRDFGIDREPRAIPVPPTKLGGG